VNLYFHFSTEAGLGRHQITAFGGEIGTQDLAPLKLKMKK
jgi:hypothetical protein